jgi:hypothetical protein
MSTKSDAGYALDQFTQDVGIPNHLTFDGSGEQTGKKTRFNEAIRHYRIQPHEVEPYSPFQNRAELAVHIIKSKWKKLMIKRKILIRLWDFAFVWICEIYSRQSYKGGRTGLEKITGDTVDISEWIDFSFYDLIWYWDTPHADENPKIGRWIGVSHRVGSALCYWVVNSNGKLLARTTVQHVTADEMATDEVKQKIASYTSGLERFLGDSAYVSDLDGFDQFVNDDEPDPFDTWRESQAMQGLEEPPLVDEAPDIDDIVNSHDPVGASDAYHSYLGAEVLLPDARGNKRMAKVIKRVRDEANELVGTHNPNPILDTSLYEVEFPDGTIDQLTANVIAENLFSQLDSEGKQCQLLSEIIEHKSDASAIPASDGFLKSRSGNLHPKKK